jgi:hypothetical protein
MVRYAKKTAADRGFEPASQTRKAMVQDSDVVYGASQHIDRLMRRVVLLMFDRHQNCLTRP